MRCWRQRSIARAAVAAVTAALAAGAVAAGPAAGQAADPPEIRVHKLIKPRTIEEFLNRGERAVVSCDTDCNVVMRLVASERVARKLGRTRSRVIAKGSAPVAAGFRGIVTARPRGIVAKRLREGALPGGFGLKIRFKAFAIS